MIARLKIKKMSASAMTLGILFTALAGGWFQGDVSAHSNRPERAANSAVCIQDESAKDVQPAARDKFKVQKHGGIVYASGEDYELKCDVYQPEGKGPFPAILAVHGGGWFWGAKWHMIRHARYFCKAGFVVVSINYRHAPQHAFPAQINDCKRAVCWLRSNAEKYNIEKSRVGAFGYSAGGHLVALLAVTDPSAGWEGNRQIENSRIQAAMCGGAPCEFSWVGDRTLFYWLKKTKSQRPELYEKIAPLTYVSGDDPPFFFFHGTHDSVVPQSSSQKMKKALEQLGIDARYTELEGYNHFETFSSMKYMRDGVEFFNEKLKIPNNSSCK